MLDRLHPFGNRRCREATLQHQRDLRGKRSHGDLVAAATQLVQDRRERE
jgi:hypothetical protein